LTNHEIWQNQLQWNKEGVEMKKILRRFILVLSLSIILCYPSFAAHKLQVLFYTDEGISDNVIDDGNLLEDAQQNIGSINIIAPQVYQLDKNGLIYGSVDQRLLTLAHQHQVKIMPLIINSNFNQSDFHKFLYNSAAQKRAINRMVNLCLSNGFWGIQFDFENINYLDKDAYTKFYQLAAKEMHQHGLKISMALLIWPENQQINNNYESWKFENWCGGYDYVSIAKCSDFIVFMAYDQHTSHTPPGPIAGFSWVQKLLGDLLKEVPAEKIFLGVPAYSGYWSVDANGCGSFPSYTQISYDNVKNLLAKSHVKLTWNETDKIFYTFFDHLGVYNYIFAENAKSFATKLSLAEKYHLPGIAVWQLGQEDSGIWKIISHL
jgi:spore germination protein